MTKEKIISITNYASMGVIFLSLGYMVFIGWAMFWPFVPVTVPQPFKPAYSEYYAGQLLEYTTKYCRHTSGPVTVHHQLVCSDSVISLDTTTVILQDQGLMVKKGCGVLTKGIHIPQDAPTGTCHIEETLFYDVNPLSTIRVNLETAPFTILEKGQMNWQEKMDDYMRFVRDYNGVH